MTDGDNSTNVSTIDVVDFGVDAAGSGATFYVICGGTGPVGWTVGAGCLLYQGIRIGWDCIDFEALNKAGTPLIIDSPINTKKQNNFGGG